MSSGTQHQEASETRDGASALPRVAAVSGTRAANVVSNWQRAGLVRLAAICDLDRAVADRQAEAAEHAGFERPEVFDDLEAMLDRGGFDGVFIGTPDSTHHAVARAAIDRAIPCVIEKPMTVTLDEARDLVTLARERGSVAMVMHEFRHVPAIREAKRRIDAGEIGTPRLAITLDYCGRMGSFWRRRAWRKSERSPHMSLTLAKAIHQIDVQNHLMGAPVSRVYATAGEDHYGNNYPSGLRNDDGSIPEDSLYHPDKPLLINGVPNEKAKQDNLPVFSDDTGLHDNQVVALDYADGKRGSYVECFFTPDYCYEHTIIGDLGRIVLRLKQGDPNVELEMQRTGSTERRIQRILGPGAHNGGDLGLGEVFVEAIRSGRASQPTVEDGAHAVALCKAIDRSSESRQPIEVEGLEPAPTGATT